MTFPAPPCILDQKYLQRFLVWYWRRMDRSVKHDVLRIVKKEKSIVHEMKRRKANWIGHIWRRNCLLKALFEERRKERLKQRKDYEEDESCY